MAAACFCRLLEGLGDFLAKNPGPCEKNFKNSKNFVCICGKMGYNKVYE